jgi:hypothetical protein
MLSDVKSGEQVAFIFISKIYLALRLFARKLFARDKKSIYYLGVKSAEEFIELMNQKTSNKNWIQDDYHIDHIWPVHWFSEALKENAEKTCLMINHHSNLRPIRAEENLIRSKQDFDILKYEDFAKYKNYLNISILEEIKLYKNW